MQPSICISRQFAPLNNPVAAVEPSFQAIMEIQKTKWPAGPYYLNAVRLITTTFDRMVKAITILARGLIYDNSLGEKFVEL